MKYSLVNGERSEAQPGLSGNCLGCNRPVIAKCGKIKIWHWAHHAKCVCDPWWENETEWHRNWKNCFPDDWQERTHTAQSGEKHRADVKTIKDWVIEFQHSPISSEERQARNDFYEKLVWVVNGARRKNDKTKFFESLQAVADVTNAQSPIRRIFKILQYDCALLRDWTECSAPVFFDFSKEEPMLWCLLPKGSDGKTHILAFLREGFIAFHRNELVGKDFFSDLIKNFEATIRKIR